ncbi:MAG TPA: cupin domain-containing protein [Saprospiraceae bacterium]|nr:cupin domain-containing protein [Saprospiraceae bacterium]
MAKSGQIIYNKISKDKIIFLKTREETKGELLQFENYHQTKGIGPVAHRHPLQEEKFILHTGRIAINIDGIEQIVSAGKSIVVKPDSLHFWRIIGDQELHMTTEFRPALHFEEIIETIASLSQTGKMDKEGNPNPMQMSATLNAYYGEFFLDTMPRALQKFLFGFFGKILLLAGFKKNLYFDDLKVNYIK